MTTKNPTQIIGQSDFLLYNQDSLVGLHTQDYKSLCAAVAICATLGNIQTHTDNTLTILYE